MRIYIDVDGTILSQKLDLEFKDRWQRDGYAATVAWYVHQGVANLRRRWWLLLILTVMAAVGIELVLWTNRFDRNREATKANLGWFWRIFQEHQFWNSTKGEAVPQDGWVIDNEPSYVAKARRGICVPSF